MRGVDRPQSNKRGRIRPREVMVLAKGYAVFTPNIHAAHEEAMTIAWS
jgi:hypothetical protein